MPGLAALWWENDEGVRRLLHDRRAHRAASASFAQINEAVARDLRTYVVDRVLSREPTTVIDAYAGSGDTAAAIAERGASVTAIELDAEAERWCRSRLPETSRSIHARVEDVIDQTLPSDSVILNPPRAGVDSRVSEVLEEASPKPASIIYVSCNPATLARDVSRMPSYRIESIVAFDMFPQTAHVETVCELVPA
jgi:23S rRNA (uracil1939-C5)-methyltransferase